MVYEVRIDSVAKRVLKKLAQSDYRAIERDIDALAVNPRPNGVVELSNTRYEQYRIRSGSKGDFRIIYTVHDTILLVNVVRIDRRKDVYRKR